LGELAGSLKDLGIEVVTFRFTGIDTPLEVSVEIDEEPRPRGRDRPERFFLPPDGERVGNGTINLAILPPSVAGSREETRIILQSVSGDKPKRTTTTVNTGSSPLWYGWQNRSLVRSSQLDDGPLRLERGKEFVLLRYVAKEWSFDRKEGSPGREPREIRLTLKCRAGEKE
jgi:hypothetical protein